MSQTVNVPGVGTLQFPDGMSQADMAAAIKKNFPEIHQQGRMSPLELQEKLRADVAKLNTPEARAARYQKIQDQNVAEMSIPERLAIGAGKAIYDTGRGIGEIIGKVKPEDIAEARNLDAAVMRTTSGKVGNALGYVGEAVPVGLLAGGAGAGAASGVGARMLTGALSGGAQGYAAPYASTGEKVANTLVGAGLGAAIPGAGAAAGKIVNGLATPEARALIAQGVKLTPGQMLGGIFKTAEDKLTSVPIVGGAIRNAQQRSVESFSDASINRVLGQLDMKLPKGIPSGRQALNYAQDAVSKMYNDTLGKMSATVDSQFRTDVGQIYNKYAPRLGAKADELISSITDGVLGKMKQTGATPGQIVHEIQSDLGKQAKRLMGKELQSDKNLGYAIKDLQSSVKDMLKRQNPADLNTAYQKAGAAFNNLAKVQKAATYAGSEKGLVTPGTLRQAVRASDVSAGKKAYSQGRVAMQDLAEAGKDVIPSKVPDSGTAGRLLATGGVGGAVTAAAMGHPVPLIGTLAASAAAHAAYSRAGQALMERALTPHVNPVSNFLAHLAQSRLATPANALAMRPLSPYAQAPQVPQQ